jgi:hypothetical protein
MKWQKKSDRSEKWLEELLKMPVETDWLEFKSEYKLFTKEGKVAEKQRDEFIKDILGLTNGNCHTIRKNKYLIIGVDDSILENNERVLHPINYRLPTQSEISRWLKNACDPVIVGIECEKVAYKNGETFVIKIPPSFDLHETKRNLDASSGYFREYSIFMRQDENTVLASVHDGITIEQRKHLFRQEIANPPALLIGVITGGFVAFIIGRANIKTVFQTIPISETNLLVIFTLLGIFFGGSLGWIIRQLTEVRYTWRYMTTKQKVILFSLCIAIIIVVIASFKFSH